MCYMLENEQNIAPEPLPGGERYFSGGFRGTSTRDVRPTQTAVAGKTRHRSKRTTAMSRRTKKTSAGVRRRAPPRAATRRGAPVAKTPLRRKPDEGVSPGMTSKKTTQRQGFRTNEFIVYPSHGVGQILAIEEQEVAGAKLELFVINFVKDKMTLRVPTAKIASVGMRKLAEPPLVRRALETLKGRARIKRTIWSRRAQEYEAKINSGDIVAIAEVVRDLYRSETQPEQSYSERQLYEAALDQLSREISVVQRITETEAIKEIEAALAKGPRRGPKPAEAEGEDEDVSDLLYRLRDWSSDLPSRLREWFSTLFSSGRRQFPVNARGKVIARCVHPPIPDRRRDWCAYHEGEKDWQHCGWGASEAEARADLERLDDEWVDYLEWKRQREHEETGRASRVR